MTLSQLPLISIAGRTLAEPIRARLIEVVVDDHLVLPDSFTLRFSFDDELWDRLGAAMSAEVVIKAGRLGETPSDALITAEITGIEAVYEEGVRYLVVRGYDKSHRLHAGRRTRSFKNVTDSDIARKVASEAGIPVGTIEPTTLVHDHVSQINMTDWEFLRDRAAEVGFSVAVREGKFTFAPSEGKQVGEQVGDCSGWWSTRSVGEGPFGSTTS
jgi:phage protein D